MKREESQDVVFSKFNYQFEREFGFDVAAFAAREPYTPLDLRAEWARCGGAVEALERHHKIFGRWPWTVSG